MESQCTSTLAYRYINVKCINAVCLSICMSIHLYVCPSVCLSVCQHFINCVHVKKMIIGIHFKLYTPVHIDRIFQMRLSLVTLSA